jgi:hypothetical protein
MSTPHNASRALRTQASMILLSLATFTSASVAQSSTPAATTAASSVVSYAYVGSTNAHITPFAVHADGTATKLTVENGPSGSVVVSSGFVWGADQTHITTYTRNSNGTLSRTSTIDATAHNDTPQGSGLGSLTLDKSGRTLYAGEIDFQGADNNAYAAFSVGSTGKLGFVANSPINVDAGGPLTFSPANHFAYTSGCFFLGFEIVGYARAATNGALSSVATNASQPVASDPNAFVCPVGQTVSARSVLALAYNDSIGTGTAANNKLATYRIQQNGSLTLVNNSEKATSFAAISDLRFDPTGQWLAVVGANGLQIFRLLNTGLLAAGPRVLTGTKLNHVQWDNKGHVVAMNGTSLFVYTFSNNTLKAAAGSPHALSSSGTLAVLPVQ